MQRWLIVLAGAMAACAIDTSLVLAAESPGVWPDMGGAFSRGGGSYLSPWKIFAAWLIFLAWVRTTDWISQDGQLFKLKYGIWNPIAFFSFLLAFLLLWTLPWFGVGMLLMIIAYVAPLTAYVIYRNQQVQSFDKVLTRKHLRRMIARGVNKIGIKMEGAEDEPRELGPDLQLSAMGGATERDDNVNLLTARQSLGYLPARELLFDALEERATHVMLDFSAQTTVVRYQIDGIWADRTPLDRANGDLVLAVFKGLSALNINDRRNRQSGTFGMEVGKEKYICKITSQGTQTGERALVHMDPRKLPFKTLDDIGMRPKMQEHLDEMIQQNGLILFSAMPVGGLTTTMDVVILSSDRFIRNWVAVADANKLPEREIENLHMTTYASAAGETAATVLPKLIRTYPDVIVVRDVSDVETLSILCEQVAQNRLMLTSVRAKEAVEALLRVLTLKIPAEEFAPAVTAVLNTRLIRKLCETCKEGYAPPAEVLKQMGLPAGRVEALYRPPTAPIDPKHPEVVCEQCQGVGYFGRTAIFELLVVDDEIRKVLTTAPKLDTLRAAARKSKHRTLQEEGVLLVARGITSLQELLRVLKQ
ncbi:MAG: Flp pilus assembly complex ATPase component TadA [Planctomycetia bacterium]|nr:Flp pilus assembly complex ATPase component TadA [Planctomycetia bacterium]